MSNSELENFKNLKTIWKNTYDKILEIKVRSTDNYRLRIKGIWKLLSERFS